MTVNITNYSIKVTGKGRDYFTIYYTEHIESVRLPGEHWGSIRFRLRIKLIKISKGYVPLLNKNGVTPLK